MLEVAILTVIFCICLVAYLGDSPRRSSSQGSKVMERTHIEYPQPTPKWRL